MNKAQLLVALDTAIGLLIEEQPDLLNLDVTERALSHYLAMYIMRFIPNTYHVDVEYNRHGGDPKRLDLPPRDAGDRDLRATTVFPDIIIHQRNTDDRNLLVLEMKKPGGGIEYDKRKLRAFRSALSYQFAAHVILGLDSGEIIHEVIWIDD